MNSIEKPSLSIRVGRLIAEHRKSEGLTQAKLSEMMQVEKETLSRIETGKISPSLDRIEQIASLLHRPVYDFFLEPTENDLEHSILEMFQNMNVEQKKYVYIIIRELTKLTSYSSVKS
ncbi:DNA-binding transcriptional regulator, XRE-family HTH domain [Arsukibacterium tuosuense]|uniref:DNA-binding transcriptional regulator, XRE-family HTH domain n=2 Tax=Arsukibacterium tuosuense TaxID=1323745 RepID=A0A285IZF9_9GAMM|nr:DNA-binding transcriptional regulator, XRE-family HTH domain [Arsukibacterium tuosuense]